MIRLQRHPGGAAPELPSCTPERATATQLVQPRPQRPVLRPRERRVDIEDLTGDFARAPNEILVLERLEQAERERPVLAHSVEITHSTLTKIEFSQAKAVGG